MSNALILNIKSPFDINTECPAARLLYRGQDPGKVKSDADIISKKLDGVAMEAGMGNSPYAVDVILPSGTPNAETSLRSCLEELGYNIGS